MKKKIKTVKRKIPAKKFKKNDKSRSGYNEVQPKSIPGKKDI